MSKKNEHELGIEVKIDGSTSFKGDSQSLEFTNGMYVQRFSVDQRLDSPDFFSIQFAMMDGNNIQILDSVKAGAKVELCVGYKEQKTIFMGEISYIEPHFSVAANYITISGYDLSHRLTRGTVSRTFGDGHKMEQNPGSLLGTVVGDSKALKGEKSDGLSAETKASESKLEYVAQVATNDYQFIQSLVGSFGRGWDAKSYESDNKISLKPLEKGSVALKICRDKFDPEKDAIAVSADFRLSTVRQVARVEVRGWDAVKKKPILGVAEATSSTIGGTEGFKQAGKAHYGGASAGRVLSIVDIPVASEGEAKEVAQSIMDKLAMDWMSADVVVNGRSELHAGMTVELVDFGKRYSGEFLVEGCQHVFMAGGSTPYQTYLKLMRNGSPEP